MGGPPGMRCAAHEVKLTNGQSDTPQCVVTQRVAFYTEALEPELSQLVYPFPLDDRRNLHPVVETVFQEITAIPEKYGRTLPCSLSAGLCFAFLHSEGA